MDVHNKLTYSTGAYRHSSELWRFDAEMLSVAPGEGAGGATLLARVHAASRIAAK